MAVIYVDDKKLEADEAKSVLQICVENDIFIPHLCHMEDEERPNASCRLCFIEIEGVNDPVPACTEPVRDGIRVWTDTPRIRRLQRTAFELLISTHRVDCKNCPSNKKCLLQNLAKFLKVPLKPKRLDRLERDIKAETDHPFLVHDHTKCILCGKCIARCEKLHGRPYLLFARRGLNTYISFFGEKDADRIPCGNCHACVEICPVSALLKKKETDEKAG
jgi:NADH dehydrogenase/NADH:ubiquinone oxidoreductase subunit G